MSEVVDIPRMTIVQPTSSEGEAGKLRCSTGLEYDSLRVAVLSMSEMRQYWSKSNRDHPMCKSADMVTPDLTWLGIMADSGIDTAPKAPQCDTCGEYVKGKFEATCPNAAWQDEPREDGSKSPLCKETHCYVMVDVETGMPFRLDLKGLSIKESRNLRTALRYRSEPHSLAFDLGTKKNKQWYEVRFSGHKPTSQMEQTKVDDALAELSGEAPF